MNDADAAFWAMLATGVAIIAKQKADNEANDNALRDRARITVQGKLLMSDNSPQLSSPWTMADARAAAIPLVKAEVRKREGFKPNAYALGDGGWTVGYGFYKKLTDGTPVTSKTTMTVAQAEKELDRQMWRVDDTIKLLKRVPTAHQLAAFVDLHYNVGGGGIRDFKGITYFNNGEIQRAADAFLTFYLNPAHLRAGILNRRKYQRAMFLTPD